MSDQLNEPTLEQIALVNMETLQLSTYKALSAIGIREATGKAEAAEFIGKQEMFKALIWSAKHDREKVALEIEKDVLQRNKQLKRPCMTLGCAVSSIKDDNGTRFSCAWSGLIAYGESPEIACQNFDRMWVGGEDEL